MENSISDVVSMSESSTYGKKSKKKDDPEALATELTLQKKKLKVLKQAMKDEKAASEKIQTQLQEAQAQIVTLKTQLDDKNAQYKQLMQDKTNLEDSLLSKGATKPGSVVKEEAKEKAQPSKQPRALPGPLGGYFEKEATPKKDDLSR